MTNFDKNDFELLQRKCSLALKIVKTLTKDKTLTHNELAKKVGRSKQSLSNAIKIIDPFDVLFIRRIGKNVYYSLTFRGYEFNDFANHENQPIEYSPQENNQPFYATTSANVKGVKMR